MTRKTCKFYKSFRHGTNNNTTNNKVLQNFNAESSNT